MYEIKGRVRLSETGSEGIITLPSIINYFQDTSTFQSEDLKVGTEYLKKQGAAWVLSAWQVIVERYPKVGEEISVGTWASGFKNFFGDRNFIMKDVKGNVVAYANSIWVHLDIETGRPVKPDAEEMEKYGMEPPYPMEYASRKVPMPKDMTPKEPIRIRKYHIDTNHHVNNCRYVQMAAELLEEEGKQAEFSAMRAEYKKSAVYGDVIYPFIKQEGTVSTVALCDEEGKPYAVIELKDKGE